MEARCAEMARQNEEQPPESVENHVVLKQEDEAQVDPAVALGAERDRLATERDQLKDQLLRLYAEFDNYRKRVARQAEENRKAAAEDLLRELLSVADHLQMALVHAEGASEALVRGVDMVLRQLMDLLERNGVKPIAALQAAFNPELHEAVMQRECRDVPPSTVVEEFQRGYLLGDRLLRPAKVVVSCSPSAEVEEVSVGIVEEAEMGHAAVQEGAAAAEAAEGPDTADN